MADVYCLYCGHPLPPGDVSREKKGEYLPRNPKSQKKSREGPFVFFVAPPEIFSGYALAPLPLQ